MVYTLNGFALVVDIILVAIMQNNQNEDGSIAIPKVLEPYIDSAFYTI